MAAREKTAGRPVLVRFCGVLTAALAAVGLVLLPVPSGNPAHAADSGSGSDSGSAVTKSGTKGPYDDFSDLKVTVEQTKGLRSQAVRVSWTGGQPTLTASGPFGADYLQIMQCWGNSPDGPDRTQCEFGQGPLLSAGAGGLVSQRQVGNPSAQDVNHLYDPAETEYPREGPTRGFIPFRPAVGDAVSDQTNLGTYFSNQNTNEQPYNSTGADGSGQSIFHLDSSADSDVLNCGAVAEGETQPQPCWLVVVPRGTHEPDGTVFKSSAGLLTSALSASNWAQRIVFRLDFAPNESFCPIGQLERPTTGSEMIQEAMGAWEPSLCTGEKITYSYDQQSDDVARDLVLGGAEGSAGLAFIQRPVQPPPGSAPFVHAPVAISGLVIGYNIEVSGSSVQVPRLRLNARLVAKLLTQSYHCDLPGPNSQVFRGKLPQTNPTTLYQDPEFKALNAGFRGIGPCQGGLIVPQNPSDAGAQLWRWLRSDPDAANFLKGKPDPWGMKINASFLDEHADAADSTLADFPRPDPTAWVPAPDHPDLTVNGVGVNPFGGSLHDDATRVRDAYNQALTTPDLLNQPPKLTGNPQQPGMRFEIGLTDVATATRYRLGTAELLNAHGDFVSPTIDAMTKAVNAMKESGTSGVLDQNPALRTPGAYPLTSVTYAAASTGLDAKARSDYATLIRFAAGSGQTPGIGLGLLPPGYAPLTPALKEQAQAAATRLMAGAPSVPAGQSDNGGASGGSMSFTGGGSGGTASSGGGTGGTSAGTGGTPSPGGTPAASAAGGTSGGSTPPGSHNVAESGSSTPGIILGAVRWVLLIVLVAGVAGSLGGPLLMRAGAVHGTGRKLLSLNRGNRKTP
jgi:hypothetical protein